MPRVRRRERGQTRLSQRVWHAGPIVLIVALASFDALLLLFPGFRHATWHQISISVVRQQVDYNALYFAKPGDLPSHISPGTLSEFSFAIKREGEPTEVRYTVVLTDRRGTSLLTSRDIRLQAGTPSVITEDFSVPVAGTFEVGVTLSSQGTAIAFHGRAS